MSPPINPVRFKLLLAAPFGSMLARLREPSGAEHGPWALPGLFTDRPVLWFDPHDLTVLAPDQVRAAPVGLVMPVGHSLSMLSGDERVQAPVLSQLGRLPFGWGAFDAVIYDLSAGTVVEFTDQTGRPAGKHELAEGEAHRTQLTGETIRELAAPDRSRVFVGAAPTLRVRTTLDHFREQWKVTVEPVSEHCDAAPRRLTPLTADLFVESGESSEWLDLPLAQPNLLGADPWGSFDVTASGPLGQGGRFRISVVPPLRVEHDWSEWHQDHLIKAVLRTSAEVQATDAHALNPRTFALPVRAERTPIRIQCTGYGGHRWSVPLELHLPMPSWAIHDADSATPLTSWSTQPATVTLSETDGSSPLLVLRTATPWGVPKAATACLCHNDTVLFSAPVPLDARGLAKLDLQPFLANARHAGHPRMRLRLDLELARTVSVDCLWLDRRWKVETLTVTATEDQLLVTWNERFPAQGRVLRAYSRLTPWEPPRSVKIDSHARGRWEGNRDILATEVGRYRLELGIEDEWTGAYESAARCDWDYGTSEQWRARPLYTEPSIDGCLFRYLLVAADSEGGEPPAIPIRNEERGAELTTKVLLARRAVEGEDARNLKRIDRLLDRVWLWPLMHGILEAGAVEPRSLVAAGVWPQARFRDPSVSLESDEADGLWRQWTPLGAWADLHGVVSNGDPAARQRLERWLGSDVLRALGPVAQGGRVRLRGADGTVRTGCIVGMAESGGSTAFDIHALRGALALQVRLDDESGPSEFSVMDSVGSVGQDDPYILEAFYSKTPSAMSPHPEASVVELVRCGRGAILKQIEQHCEPYPTSPIGEEAFQSACFGWAIAAAEQPNRRAELADLCRDTLPLTAEALAQGPPNQECMEVYERLRAELRARTHHFAGEEPLLAVHAISWLVASLMVWGSLGRPAFVYCPQHQLVDLSTRLYDLAPSLLAHDLTKVCAIEALLAFKASHAPRSGQTHE